MMSELEAWYMDESREDQKLPHRLEPNQRVTPRQLEQIGVYHWKLNADIYENDPELQKIREEKGYSYMDIITIHPDKLPDYENKNYTTAMRLFVGEPVWKAYNRPADDFDIRKAYVNSLRCSSDA
ncbi:hypothetical protein cypCar_00014309 [Cyprinus carpio]|nr:hypothetical protein cypCar_00014309 [Cyprinus carpio]